MTESIGMMEGAFFVPKTELIQWVNTTFKFNISKIEEACTGAIYCQIIDAIHPGEISMNKINWKAKLEHEFLNNFKLLQQAFTKCSISKNIDVERLIKGRSQDNLELLQFLKRYFDMKFKNQEYDPVSKRKGAEFVSPFNHNKSIDSKAPSKKDLAVSKSKENEIKKENMKTINHQEKEIKTDDNEEDIKNLKNMITETEGDRDFYLSKLRDIEFLITNVNCEKTNSHTIKNIIEEIIFSKVETKVHFDEKSNPTVKPLNENKN